ncbi:MAG: hypothetical protein LBI44_03560 [Oscillospiraceae bacterium]|jgi:hypothetical protein|nr:hypothetical protein [Oscillospiraceae bacterium]
MYCPSNYATFLFANIGFMNGLARVLDIGDTLSMYNYPPSGEAADYKAMKADWLQVGDDLRFAMEMYANEQNWQKNKRQTAKANKC